MVKKIINFLLITLILFSNVSLPTFCTEILKDDIDPEYFDTSLLHKNTYTPLIIQDEFIVTPEKKSTVKPSSFLIEDEIVKNTLQNKKFQKIKNKNTIIEDEPIVLLKDKSKYKKVKYTGKVNTDIGYEVTLKPLKKISTKTTRLKIKDGMKYEKYNITLPELGEEYEFRVMEDLNIDGNTVIEKGSIVKASVDNVSARAMGGAPAELKLDNFVLKTKEGKEIYLNGSITSSGYTLSPWIGLAELATTPFLFGLAVPALRVLPGGQAIITPRKNYTVFYNKTPN